MTSSESKNIVANKLITRSLELVSETVSKRYEDIKAGHYQGPDDTRYLLERLYDDVAEFMSLAVLLY